MPHLWFDREAKEAAEFYISLFDGSRLIGSDVLHNTPSGDAETVDFELAGQPFEAISAGPYFMFNPSVSLMVACSTAEEVDRLWKALSSGGSELMPLGEYPFSRRYAWVQDRYGLSWQLSLTDGEQPVQKITPNLLFSGMANGRAEEAVRYYAKVFNDSGIDVVSQYGEGEADSSVAKVNFIGYRLLGQHFSAMDNGFDVDYTFNEAFSLMVYCDSQEEIDDYWDKLSRVPEAEACGWLKDQFGVSWQIVPREMSEMMDTGTEEQIQRIVEAFLQMKKFDIATLKKAFEGRQGKPAAQKEK